MAVGVGRTHEAEEERELSHNRPPRALVVETTMTMVIIMWRWWKIFTYLAFSTSENIGDSADQLVDEISDMVTHRSLAKLSNLIKSWPEFNKTPGSVIWV